MQITLTQLRRTPAPALDQVRSGEEVVVTQDGIPLFRMVPCGRNSRYEELIASGVLKPPKEPRDIDEIRARVLQAAEEKRRGAA